MKILIFTPLGKGGKGGVDRMMDELREELIRQNPTGVFVQFIATRGPSALWPVVYVLSLLRAVIFGLMRTHDVWHINLGAFGSAIRKHIIVQIARAAGQPYVIHLHGGHFREYWENKPRLHKNAIRNLFLHANAVIVLGSVWKDLILKHVPECSCRIVVLPNATRAVPWIQRDNHSVRRVKILFLGRLGPEKGIPELLEALDNLPSTLEWECVLAGDGMVHETRTITSARFPGRISVPGWLGPAEVDKLLSMSDILVLPSHVENLPMSMIEAFAHGLAVIATPVGAIQDILEDEKTGLLVPVGDTQALTTALKRLIIDCDLRERLGQNARDIYQESLTVDSYLRKMLLIWKSASK